MLTQSDIELVNREEAAQREWEAEGFPLTRNFDGVRVTMLLENWCRHGLVPKGTVKRFAEGRRRRRNRA